MYSILICLFSIVSAELCTLPTCPDETIYSPCDCVEDYDMCLTSVECRGYSYTLSKIQSIIKSTLRYNMSFGFKEIKFGDIPSDLFEGHQSVDISFVSCKIGSFGDRPFKGLENFLEVLNIDDSIDKSEQDLKTFRLGHLKKLRKLDFTGNDIVKLGNDWFEDGPESLKFMDLESNDIEVLGDKAFASLKNIEQIWLGDNRFKKVSRSMFPNPANKLDWLEMSYNGIEELPLDMFEGFPALEMIHLEGNKLKTLPENIWGPIWKQLKSVYVDEMNEFICDEELKWVYKQILPKKHFRGTCRGDNKFSGRKLKSLTLKDFE